MPQISKPDDMKTCRTLIVLLLMLSAAACHRGGAAGEGKHSAQQRFEQAIAALDSDSVRTGELLLNDAIRLAHKEKDWHTLYLAQQRLAESLAWGNSQAALEMAQQALRTYEQHPDDERNHIMLLDYAGTYASQVAFNETTDFTEAFAYTQRAYELADSLEDAELLCETLTSLANIHWATEDFQEALRCAREAERYAPEYLLPGTLQVLARCLVSCDSVAAAEAIYQQMEPGDDVQAAYIVQSNLAKLALRRHDTESAEAAIDEAFSHAEELYYRALRQKDDYYETALSQERENERLRYTDALHRMMLWGSLVLISTVALAIFVAMQGRLRTRELLHRQEAVAQQEQLRQRDSMIHFLQDFILERSEIIQKLGESADRHIHISPHEWEEMERTLDAIDSDRFMRLRARYPDLKDEDVRLCILIRLHLTNRAIGNIFGISISAVQHRKLKLKKEVFGEEDPETTLEQVIDRQNLH